MAKVIAPSIFITNNYNTIKNFFIDSNGSLKSLPENDGSLLITPKNNSYLESFEYSVNYDKPDIMSLNITLIDIDNTLENKLFINPQDHKIAQATEAINKDKTSQNGAFEAIQILDGQHTLYVSFGVGDKLSDWSDPRAFYIYKVVLDVTNTGLRKYKLTLFPSNNVLFKPRLKYNTQKPNQEKEFLFARNSANIIATTPVIKGQSSSVILYKLLKNYIRIICNIDDSHIIGIMPELSNLTTDVTLDSGQVVTSSIGFGYIYDGLPLDSFKKTFGLDIKRADDARRVLFSVLTQPEPGITPMSTGQAEAELLAKYQTNASGFWTIQSEQVKNGINPQLPDWFAPINKINTGLKSLLTKSKLPDDLIITEENNAKLIKLWADFGLIPKKDPLPKRVIIFGLELMIDEYLYNAVNSGNAQANIAKALSPKSLNSLKTNSLKIANETNERILLIEQEKYYRKYTATMSKKKISSDFGETLAFDELAIDDPNENFKYLQNIKEIKDILETLDIPIFTNNIKNSNILQLSMDNSDQYFAGLNIGVRSNAIKFYFDAIQQNLDSLNLGNLKIKSVFDEYVKILNTLITAMPTYSQTSIIINNATGASSTIEVKDRMENYWTVMRKIRAMVSDQIRRAVELDPNFDKLSLKEKIEIISNPNLDTSKSLFTRIKDGSLFSEFKSNFSNYGIGAFMSDYRYSNTGPDSVTGEDKKLFEEIKRLGLFEQFGSLILENNNNINYELLIFSLAKRNLILSKTNYRPTRGFEFYEEQMKIFEGKSLDYKEKYKNNYIQYKEGYDWYMESASLKRQQDDFEYANLMFALFKPEPSNTRSNNIKGYQDQIHNFFFNFTPRNFDLSQEAIIAEIAKYTANQTYKLTLKTLPFFHIDSARMYMFKPCLVISKRLKALGVNLNSNISQFDFFTGAYNIYGFKHVITPTDCYSMFALIKKTGASIGL